MIIELRPNRVMLDTYMLAPLVRGMGHSGFGDSLLGAVSTSVGAELFSSFSFNENGQPAYCVARAFDTLGNSFAEHAAQRYVAGYWQFDPALKQLIGAQDRCGMSVVCQQAGSQIEDSGYRALCYEQPGLIDRLSILVKAGPKRTLFSAYRHVTRGPFGLDEIQQFAASAEILACLIDKHVELSQIVGGRSPDVALPSVPERLRLAFPMLSAREREVCSGLICGLAAKEIAHTYGIETSSVVTYKKRAFIKLGVLNRRAFLRQWKDAMDHLH